MEFIWFMLFSTIEGLSILALMLKMFSYKYMRFILPALFLITIMNLQSFFLREELQLANVVPLINIFLFIAFLSLVIKIPFFASIIITGAGYFAFAIIQACIIEFSPNNFFTIAEVQTNAIKGFLLQTITAAINFFIAWLLNKKRIGFISDIVEKLRMKYEKAIVLVAVAVIFGALVIFLIYENLLLHIFLYVVAAAFFIYYAYRKETA